VSSMCIQMNPVHVHNIVSSKSVFLLSFHLSLGLPSCLFPSGLRQKYLCISPIPPACYTSGISHFLNSLIVIALRKGTKYDSTLCKCSVSSLYIPRLLYQMVSAALSRTPSICILPSTKFYTHAK
jgi:hypothetical protein